MTDTILILDFGSQVTQLIARRLREDGVYTEILPCTADADRISALSPKGNYSVRRAEFGGLGGYAARPATCV